MFSHARPGTSDTSAIPTDQVNNPGTINAINNFSQRPEFTDEDVIKWRKVAACPATPAAGQKCWCEPGRDGKCWLRSREKETVHHILKGGEDSIGALEAIQRVYFNIGSCSEQCWLNHLTDLRQLDPQARNFGQTPFDIGQCRRDCPNFRAIEDRLPNIVAFLFSQEANATDLAVARENERKAKDAKARYTQDDLVADLDQQFGTGAVARGREVFAESCARCHSSIPVSAGGAFRNRDFRALDDKTGLRARLAEQRPGDARHRSRHVPLPRAALQPHDRPRLAGVRLGDAARPSGRIPTIREPARRRARLLPQHLAAQRCGRTRPSCTTTRSGRSCAGSRSTATTTSTARPTWTRRRSSSSRPTRRRRAGRTTPASMAASSSTRRRCRSCSIRRSACRRSPGSTSTSRSRWVRARSGRQGEGRSSGSTIVVPDRARAPAGARQLPAQALHRRPGAAPPQARRARPATRRNSSATTSGEEDHRRPPQRRRGDPAAAGRAGRTLRKHPQLLEAYSSCTAEIENDGHRFGERPARGRQEGADRLPGDAVTGTAMTPKPPFAPATLALAAAAAVAIQLAGCDSINEFLHPTPAIRFAPAGEGDAKKPDLARSSTSFRSRTDDLQKLTPTNIANFDQEQVDQIYARLTAGPIPDGAFDGGLVLPEGRERRPADRGDRRRAAGARGRAEGAEARGPRRDALERQGVLSRTSGCCAIASRTSALLKPIVDGDLSTIRRSRSTARTSG